MTKITRTTGDRAPENDYEALMQAIPFEEPQQTSESLMVLRETVAQYVDDLDPRSLWIVNACISEGKSLQAIADELGMTKTHVWRLRNQAFETLRIAMSTDTTIRKSVRFAETWEQSATQWVMYLAGDNEMEPITADTMIEYRDSMAETIELGDTMNRVVEAMASNLAKQTINLLRMQEQWDTGEMISTLCSKQHDYGHGNINRFGLVGVVVRLSDKVERYKNLQGRKAENESTYDTLLDIVGYCVVALMLLDETFNLNLGDDYGTHTGHE
jgi:AcrR family transcriptional regulator